MKKDILWAVPICFVGILIESLLGNASEVFGYLDPDSPFFFVHYTFFGYILPGFLTGIAVAACMVAVSQTRNLIAPYLPAFGIVGVNIVVFGIVLREYQPFHPQNIIRMWLPHFIALFAGCFLGSLIVIGLKNRRLKMKASQQLPRADSLKAAPQE